MDTERVALVTGAAGGIGAATVRELLRLGYAVTALDICAGGDVPPGVGYPLATPDDLRRVAELDPDRDSGGCDDDVQQPEPGQRGVDGQLQRLAVWCGSRSSLEALGSGSQARCRQALGAARNTCMTALLN